MTFRQAQRRASAAMGGAPGAPGASAASPPKRKADGHVLEPDEEREHEAGDAVRSSPDLHISMILCCLQRQSEHSLSNSGSLLSRWY